METDKTFSTYRKMTRERAGERVKEKEREEERERERRREIVRWKDRQGENKGGTAGMDVRAGPSPLALGERAKFTGLFKHKTAR